MKFPREAGWTIINSAGKVLLKSAVTPSSKGH